MENTNFFLLEKLYNISSIPVCVYDKERVELYSKGIVGDAKMFMKDDALADRMATAVAINGKPILFMEEILVFWGIFCDKEGRYYIWGPAALEDMDMVKIAAYRHRHGIIEKSYRIVKSSYEALTNVMAIAVLYYCGKMVNGEDIYFIWNGKNSYSGLNVIETEKYQIEKSEMNRSHNSIDYENWIIRIVENGDVLGMKQLLQKNTMDEIEIGVVAEDAKKQMEYLCVSSVFLCSRAAIRGGMNPEAAYDLSDIYLQKLEKCKSIEEMALVCARMQLDYTERVQAARKYAKGNIYVEKCKDYVAGNLRKKFKVNDIAPALGINRSYLSEIFSKQENMTIQEYVIKERCEHAANMLRYTDYSISVIAEYFCFATQSHFGKQFKRIYGMTPNEYRRQNCYIDSFQRDK